MEILSPTLSMATFNTDKFVQSFEQNLTLTDSSSEYSQIFDFESSENSTELQNKKKRRRQRRKGCDRIPRIDSPSTESSCSLASSVTTLSSGICSSIGSSMQTLNEILEEKNSLSFSSLISSSTTSSIDCNESILAEEDLDEAFSECSFPCPKSATVSSSSSSQQPKKKSKRKTAKKSSQNRNNKNPVIQQYFNQQKQFYLQIYEQQFAALSSLKNSYESSVASKKIPPHQHLGLPPLAPPMGLNSNFSVMEEFLSSVGPCEEAYFNHIKKQPSFSPVTTKNIDFSINSCNSASLILDEVS